MTFEEAITKFKDALMNGIEQASGDAEAVAHATRNVDVVAVIGKALKASGLRLAQVSKSPGEIEGDHRS